MLRSRLDGLLERIIPFLFTNVKAYFGSDGVSGEATRLSRMGLAASGLFFLASGVWIVVTSERLPIVVPVSLIAVGLLILSVSTMRKLALRGNNILAFTTHLSALFLFYFLATRFLTVTYWTDTIVGTYAGLLGVLQLQNPYSYSIKPFLDQFGFPPSFYTPRVDGSFEFHLNYPAFNFLSLLPLYLAGLHDLRDGILFFHIASVLLIFGTAPSRMKSISLAPFAFGFPLVVVLSWTDSVWAFLLLLSAVTWKRDRRLSLAFVGLAGATKQIALFVSPFLLLRLWHETSESKQRRLMTGLAALLAGFMVPNLPFIISSPSAWWAGTIAAYLPGNAPQVAGGVGLSEILIDLGISPPSYFFVALMGLATAGTMYLYSKRFARYKHFAWAMPVVILFFYYRSFPNYIIYWFVPLLPELLRYKPGGLHWNPISKLGHIQLHPSLKVSVPGIRNRMASSVLIVIMVTAVLAGVSGAYISRASDLKVEIKVDRVLDPDSIGAATVLQTTLTNLSPEPVSPRFFVKWYFLPFLYTTNSTDPLPPNSTEEYVLTATDALAAIPSGTSFKVLVFNSLNGELVSQSQTLQAELPTSSVANPQFEWWTLDSETGRRVPFGWRLVMTGADWSSGIEELDSSLAGGILLTLNHTFPGPRSAEITVSQEISFEASSLRIMVLQSPNPDTQSRLSFGARFTDGSHTLFFIFSHAASQRSIRVSPENTTITMPVEQGIWTWIPLDLPSEWVAQEWPPPRTIEFSILLETTTEGVYVAYVGEIS